MSHSQQVEDRKAKLEELRRLGVDPYGHRFTDVQPIANVRERGEALNLEAGQTSDETRVRVAGRVMLHRPAGGLVFLTIRDGTGDIQIGVSKKAVAERPNDFAIAGKLLNLGDIIGVDGAVGRTKTGELTVWASAVTMLSCRTMRRVCTRVSPIARSIPISRVRSNTASTSVFTIPNRLTSTDSASSA